jgi:hypothetical protein
MTSTAETKKPATKTRMSRAQIVEGLDQIPIGTLLTGTGKKDRLTHKQKAFAHALATGEMTQADAYRKAYKARGKPKTIGDNASRLAKHSGVQAETLAIQQAIEATKYQNAGQIKALVVHQLTQHALNEDNPPAQRIKALELLGRTHEVGLFVESRAPIAINSSMDIKARLLDQLKTFIRADVEDVEDKGADSLLAELSGEKTPAHSDARADTPPHTPPPELDGVLVSQDTHSIPLTRSNDLTIEDVSTKDKRDSQVIDSIEEKVLTTNVWSEKEGEGVLNLSERMGDISTETPPVIDSGSPTQAGNSFRVKR